jgi:hypothetical protein
MARCPQGVDGDCKEQKDADPLRAEVPQGVMESHASTLTLRLTEVFLSLQGETSRTGLPTVFIRLSGCPLRCRWCDTSYSFQGGETVTLTALLAQVADFGVSTVCVTGGEPLAQKNCLPLLAALCDAGYSVSLETSGALDVSKVDARVSRIVDIKPPESGEAARNRWSSRRSIWRRSVLCCFRPCRANCRRRNWPNGSSPTGCRCGCRCNCTKCCGETCTANEARCHLALRRARFRHRAGDCT